MTKAVCRIGDTVTGTCAAPAGGHPRTFTGTWTVGSGIVKADGIGVVREDDTGLTDCSHTFKAVGGSGSVSADGKKIHRVGDAVVVLLGGSGVSASGSPVVTAAD